MSDSLGNKRIAKNTAFLYVRLLFVLLVSIYTTRVVLRNLGIEDYGIYNVVAGFVLMFSFLNNSMSISIQRFYNYVKGEDGDLSQSDVYSAALLAQGIIAVATLLLLESVGWWYINHVMVMPSDRIFAANCVFQFSVFSLVLVVMQGPFSAAILSNERMDYYALVSVVDVVLRLVIVLSLPYLPFDRLISYGVLSFVVSVVGFLLYYLYCKRRFLDLCFVKERSSILLRRLLTFSGWNLLDMFSYTIKGQGLNVLINAFFGPTVNAARGVSNQIMSAIQGFSSNIVMAFRPQLVESYAKGELERTTVLMFSMSKISYVFLYMLSVPIVVELDMVLRLWLGDNIPEYTVPFTILVLANMVVSSLNTPLSQVMQAVGELKWYQIIRSLIITSILPLSWLALKMGMDPVSVFVVSLLMTVLNQPVSMVLLRRHYSYSYREYLKQIVLPCFCFSLLAPLLPMVVTRMMDASLLRLLLTCMVSALSSLLLIYVVVLNDSEKQMIGKLLLSRLRRAKD
ncbi:MAG: hypothetical protein J6Y37_11310 [Paludibacteraceae bacterium]|nr:hypothetical protein [Paludibacteraceae bacterium]